MALYQYDWCPYKRSRLGHRKHTQKDSHVTTQREGSRLQAKERGLRRNWTCSHLDLALPASRSVRKLISVVKATQSVVFCYGSPSKLIYLGYISWLSQWVGIYSLGIHPTPSYSSRTVLTYFATLPNTVFDAARMFPSALNEAAFIIVPCVPLESQFL